MLPAARPSPVKPMDLMRMPSPPDKLGEATEAEFLSRLRMDLALVEDWRLYSLMKADVLRACRRICMDRSSLLPYLQNDASIRPPFTVTQITEGALHAEARRIYDKSHGEIKRIYELGIDEGSNDGESWVIRWLLWRTILTGGEGDYETAAAADHQNGIPHAPKKDKSAYWDPAREVWSKEAETRSSVLN